MKKLIMLMFLLLMSLSSFSQTVTQTDSIVRLEVPIVKLVIKDLVTFDGTVLELTETKRLLDLSNDKLLLKDEVIVNLNTKVQNLETIITKKDEQFKLEREKSEQLLKELKGQRRKTFFYKVGTFIGAGALTLLLVR
jgi:hypothetical protein